MDVAGVFNVTNYQQTAETTSRSEQQGSVTTNKNELGMDDFFKLLTTQLIAQDPLSPMEDTEFISQMANFSSLSQMDNIAENMASVRQQQESLAIVNLIGKDILADDGNGGFIEGKVTHVDWEEGEPVPYVGQTRVPYESIVRIWEAPETNEEPLVETETPTDGAEENPESQADGL